MNIDINIWGAIVALYLCINCYMAGYSEGNSFMPNDSIAEKVGMILAAIVWILAGIPILLVRRIRDLVLIIRDAIQPKFLWKFHFTHELDAVSISDIEKLEALAGVTDEWWVKRAFLRSAKMLREREREMNKVTETS